MRKSRSSRQQQHKTSRSTRCSWAGARPPRYGLVGDQAAWRTVLAFSVPPGRLREHVVGAAVCYGRLAEPQPPCALAHSGNAAERLRWTQAGVCDGAPEAWRVAPPEH